jgi:lipid II:glycine glycyltransferase (peptidoglycan interpeptide bridge formation enzyme)
MAVQSISEWDSFLSDYPNTHLLQTSPWGELKATFGWDVSRVICGNTGAQILFRNLPLGRTFGYIPKGPVGNGWNDLWPIIDNECRKMRAIFLKVEPDIWRINKEEKQDSEQNLRELKIPAGFLSSSHSIQPKRTLVINLLGDESQILGRMKQKTRYNIRLAQKKDVIVEMSSDLETFHNLMEVTSKRDNFGIHNSEYFRQAYDLFQHNNECKLFVAEYETQPLAAIMVFAHGNRAWYFYGASSNDYRERMPTYLLQWTAMLWARARGCIEYDLWGVPDADIETLENNFTKRNDGLWGVYRFKRGFGGELHHSYGPWDKIYNRPLYLLYSQWAKNQDS